MAGSYVTDTSEGTNISTQLGFLANSAMIDNLSQSWAYLVAAGKYIAPWTYGMIVNFGATQNAMVNWQNPPAIPKTPFGSGLLVITWVEAVLPPNNGQIIYASGGNQVPLGTFTYNGGGTLTTAIFTLPANCASIALVNIDANGLALSSSNPFILLQGSTSASFTNPFVIADLTNAQFNTEELNANNPYAFMANVVPGVAQYVRFQINGFGSPSKWQVLSLASAPVVTIGVNQHAIPVRGAPGGTFTVTPANQLTTYQANSFSTSTLNFTFQNAAIANGNGSLVITDGYAGALYVLVKETAGGTATVTLQGYTAKADPGSVIDGPFSARYAGPVDNTAGLTQLNAAISVTANSTHVYRILDPWYQMRAPISAIAGGATITAYVYGVSL